jgi:hypothetical protein
MKFENIVIKERFRYDVAISFAEGDKEIAEQISNSLMNRKIII